MKRILFTIFLLGMVTGGAYAQQPAARTYTVTNVKELSSLAVNDTVQLNSDYLTPAPRICLNDVEGIVKLRIREDLAACLPETFACTVKLAVTYKTSPVSQFLDTIEVSVNYNKQTGRQYNEQSSRLFSGARYLHAKILSISNASVKPYLDLSLQLHAEKYTCLDAFRFDKKPLLKNTQLTGGRTGITIRFANTDSNNVLLAQADEFDVEWTVIDLNDPMQYDSVTGTFWYNFRNNASRVTIGRNEQSFTIRNIFEENIVMFRYRAVTWYEEDDMKRRVVGPWSSQKTVSSSVTTVDDAEDPDAGSYVIPLSAPSPAESRIDEYNSFVMIRNAGGDSLEHLARQNWQYVAVYAEEAKRKETISYFDGSLRNRQTVTTNNSDSTVLVQENVYDFNGRPAVQVLPVPVVNGAMTWYRDLSRNDSGNTYTAWNFDPDVSACQTGISPMKTDTGASRYYSVSNSYISSPLHPSAKFVPVAGGYPFTQSVFMPDNTGRLVARSGVGEKHQVSPTGKPTEYMYGTPFQEELNRLFGTEVGWNVHYKKALTIDPNGQPSVAYTDLKGRTIATSLAANPANSLDALNTNVSRNNVEVSLVSEYDLVLDRSALSLNKRINVPEAGDYRFRYSFTPQDYFPPACPGFTPCFDCIYDLEISITELFCGTNEIDGNIPQGTKVVLKRTIGGNPDSVDAAANAANSYSFVTDTLLGAKDVDGYITVSLPKGTYDIAKKLSVNKVAYENYERLFMENSVCKTLETFTDEALAQMDTVGCELTCQECEAQFASVTRAAFITGKVNQYIAIGDTLTDAQKDEWGRYYDASKQRCAQMCGEQSQCDALLGQLKLDVTPGGQYAVMGFDSQGHVVLPSPGDSNYVYRNILAPSSDAVSGAYSYTLMPSSVTIVLNGQTVEVKDLSLDQFVANWQDSWADVLVHNHPEYTGYEWCRDRSAMYAFEDTLMSFDTYAEAAGYLDESYYIVSDPVGGFFPGIDTELNSLQRTFYKQVEFEDFPSVTNTLDLTLSEIVLSTVFCNEKKTSTEMSSCIAAAKTGFATCGSYQDLFWVTLRAIYLSERRQRIEQEQADLSIPTAGERRILSAAGVWAPENEGMPDESSVKGDIAAGCISQCNSYKDVWAENLKGCGLDSLQMDAILNQLALVCMQGCDETAPMGSSSVSPAAHPTATFVSFDDVLKRYPATSPDTFAGNLTIYNPDVCSGVMIRFPQPYGHDYFAKSSPYADTCACENDVPAVDCPCSTNPSMQSANLRAKLIRTDVPDEAKCDNCIDCTKFARVFKTFVLMHSVAPASGNYNTIFENFFNQRLGFNLRYNDYLEFAGKCNRDTSVTSDALERFKNRFLFVAAPSRSSINGFVPVVSPVTDATEIRLAVNNTPVPPAGTGRWDLEAAYDHEAAELSSLLAVAGGYRGGMSAETFPGNSVYTSVSAMAAMASGPTVTLDRCGCDKVLQLRHDYNIYLSGSPSSPMSFADYVYSLEGESVPGLEQIEDRCRNTFYTGRSIAWTPGAVWHSVAISNLGFSIEESPLEIPCSFSCSPVSCVPPVDMPGGNGGSSTVPAGSNSIQYAEMSCTEFNSVLDGFYQDHIDLIPDVVSLKTTLLNTGGPTGWMLDTLINRMNDHAGKLFQDPVLFNTTNFWNKYDRCKDLCAPFTTVVQQLIADSGITVSRTNLLSHQLSAPGGAGLRNDLIARLNAAVRYAPYWEVFDSSTVMEYLSRCNQYTCDQFAGLRDSFRAEYEYILSESDQLFRDQMLAPFRKPLFDTLLAWVNNAAAQHPFHKQYDATALSKLLSTCSSCADYCVTQKDVFLTEFLHELLNTYPVPQLFLPRTSRLVSNGWNVHDNQYSFVASSLYPFVKAEQLSYEINYMSRTKLTATIENESDQPFHFWLNASVDPGDIKFSFSRVTAMSLVNVIKEDSCDGVIHEYWASYVFQGAIYYATIYAGSDAFPFYEKKDCDVQVQRILLCNRPIGQATFTVQEDPCITRLRIIAGLNAQLRYKQYTDSLRYAFRSGYVKKCMGDSIAEAFKMRYNERQYHYTLYYYDQAGNLVKTVPPAGVQPLSAVETALVDGKRKTGTVQVVPNTKTTLYTYNSLNQLVWQLTPDAGRSDFYYDRVGRLVVSQNAKQKPGDKYSYTQYDNLGRITQVGEIKQLSTRLMTADSARNATILASWIGLGTRSQVTKTFYDTQELSVAVSQQNLRGRVASSTYQEYYNAAVNTYDYGVHYSYDVIGNVGTLVREIRSLSIIGQDLKQIDYEYDVVSGKVNRVLFQAGEPDQFIHRYTYDNDNRLTAVYTGTSPHTMEKDAEYWYYLHGPLARTELGAQGVQGLDYAYTINGWLKGVNSETLNAGRDMGLDGAAVAGNPNRYIARDEFGFILQYFNGDYSPAGGTPAGTFVADRTGSGLASGTIDLFNGNISMMSTAIGRLMTTNRKPLATSYQYDQLNRIRSVNYYSNLDEASNTWQAGAAMPDWHNRFTYDADGNILTQVRRGQNIAGQGPGLDSLGYVYYAGTNRLRYVSDAIPLAWHTDDIDGQSDLNYVYDETGNLIRDNAEHIDSIYWNVYGKITRIKRRANSPKPDIEFAYSPDGHRIMKLVIPKQGGSMNHYTYYVRDAQGNIMATYERSFDKVIDYDTLGYAAVNDSLVKYSSTSAFAGFIQGLHASGSAGLKDYLQTAMAADSQRVKTFLVTNDPLEPLSDLHVPYPAFAVAIDSVALVAAMSARYTNMWASICACMQLRYDEDNSRPTFMRWLVGDYNALVTFLTALREYHPGKYSYLRENLGFPPVPANVEEDEVTIEEIALYVSGEAVTDADGMIDQFEIAGYTDCSDYLKEALSSMQGNITVYSGFMSKVPGIRTLLTGIEYDGEPAQVITGCNMYGYEAVLEALIPAVEMSVVSPSVIWNANMKASNNWYNWMGYYKTADPAYYINYIAKNYRSFVSTYQQTQNIYSDSGNGMRAYFENIRTGYSGDFYNTFVYRFFSVSRAYVDSMNVQEWMIYGSSRIGTQVSSVNLVSRKIYADVSGSWYINPVIVDINEPQVNLTSFVQVRGSKRYELSNHLGNVLSVVSDKKIFRCPSSLPADSTYFSAEVLSATDYSAFGAPLPGRSFDYLKDAVKVTVFADSFSVSANTLGWSAYNVNTVVAQDNGRLKMTQTTTWATARKSVNVIRGRNYIWRFKIDLGTFTRINAPVYNQNFSQHITGYLTITQSGTYEYRFTAHDFVVNLLFEAVPPAGPAGAVLYVDDISLEEDNRLDYATRFGFNGKEMDNETYGAGNQYDYGFRIYNPRLGRFLSVDPLTTSYPWYTPYQFAGNKPIWAIDLDGLEEKIYQEGLKDNWGFKASMAVADQTTLGKEFNDVLKSQNKLDVYYFTFESKVMLNTAGDIAPGVTFDKEGFASGAMGVTAPTVVMNKDDLSALKLQSYYFGGINSADLENSFKAGKGVVMVGIAQQLIDAPKTSDFSMSKLSNLRISSSQTMVHEEWSHAMTFLQGYNADEKADHNRYFGQSSSDSPNAKDLLTDPKYSLSNAGKAVKEIQTVVKKSYNFDEPKNK